MAKPDTLRIRCDVQLLANEIPKSAHRVVGCGRYCLPVADRAVGAELLAADCG